MTATIETSAPDQTLRALKLSGMGHGPQQSGCPGTVPLLGLSSLASHC